MLVHLAEVLGGLALFLYGISLAAAGCRRAAGGFFRGLARLVAQNRLAALLAGAGLAFTVQSAGATTAVLVSLARAGLLRAWQALGVILGGCLGGALTVQVIAFRIDQYALLIIALAVPGVLFPRLRRVQPAATALLGVGFLFLGLFLLRSGLGPLGARPELARALEFCGRSPFLGLLAGFLLVALLQSSTATVAIVLALAQQGLLGGPGAAGDPVAVVAAAVPFLLGAHAGSVVTAALAALGASREAWRIVAGHAVLRVTAALLLLPLVAPLAALAWRLADWMGGDAARAVANAHTLYNLVNVLVFLPFVRPLGRLIERLIPAQEESAARRARYLAGRHPPEVAAGLLEASRELARLARETVPLVGRAFGALEDDRLSVLAAARAAWREVNEAHRALVAYLARLAALHPTEAEAEAQHRLLFIARDLRAVGEETVEKLLDLAEARAAAGAAFSVEGLFQLRQLQAELARDLDRVAAALAAPDGPADRMAEAAAALAAVLAAERELPERSRQLLLAHFERLAAGVREASDSDEHFVRALTLLSGAYTPLADLARRLQSGAGGAADRPDGAPASPPGPAAPGGTFWI